MPISGNNCLKFTSFTIDFTKKRRFCVKIEIIEKFDYFGGNNRGSNSAKCSNFRLFEYSNRKL